MKNDLIWLSRNSFWYSYLPLDGQGGFINPMLFVGRDDGVDDFPRRGAHIDYVWDAEGFLVLNHCDLRNFKFKKGKEGNTFQLEISETRPVGFKKFQIQEGARGSNTFQFEIS